MEFHIEIKKTFFYSVMIYFCLSYPMKAYGRVDTNTNIRLYKIRKCILWIFS